MNDSFVIIYESLFNSLSGIKAFYLLTLADTSYSVLKNAFFQYLDGQLYVRLSILGGRCLHHDSEEKMEVNCQFPAWAYLG